MHQPGQQGTDDECAEQIPFEIGGRRLHDVVLSDRRRGLADHAQREKDQRDADGDPPGLLGLAGPGVEKQDHADKQDQGHHLVDRELKHLHHQRRAEFGAENHGQRRARRQQSGGRETAADQCHGGGALQHHRRRNAGCGRREPVRRHLFQPAPQFRQIGAFGAGPDHPDRPQQKRDSRRQVDREQDHVGRAAGIRVSDETGAFNGLISLPMQKSHHQNEAFATKFIAYTAETPHF